MGELNQGFNLGDGVPIFMGRAGGDPANQPWINGAAPLTFRTLSANNIEFEESENEINLEITGLGTAAAGFVDYNSSITVATNLDADVWTYLINDGQGDFTNTDFELRSTSPLIFLNGASNAEGITGAFDFSKLGFGDIVFIRNDFRVIPNVNGAYIEFRYNLGLGLDQYSLSKQLGTLANGSGREYAFQFTDLIYMGDSNTKNNPIYMQIRSSEPSSLRYLGSVIYVLKRT